MSKQSASNFGSVAGWAILAGALGGAVALLMAPRKGTETREQLKEGVNGLFEKSAKLVEEAKKGAGSRIESVRDTVGGKVHLITDAIEAGRKAATEAPTNGIPTSDKAN
ncbi:MAG: YtxH domain-containing protein [Candidatus Sericytochromatia bacterium]|nr:YtxH domain-containing protein [Candidatus Sericytochromatia bacterium]